ANSYIHPCATRGSPPHPATATGSQPNTGTINFAPSGVVISGPLGFGLPLTTTLAAGQQPVTVFLAVLDPSSHATAFTQPLAGGMSLTVSLTNSNPGVGTVPATVSFTAGSDNT